MNCSIYEPVMYFVNNSLYILYYLVKLFGIFELGKTITVQITRSEQGCIVQAFDIVDNNKNIKA